MEGRTPVVNEDEGRGGMLGLAEGPGLAALRPAGFGTSGAAQLYMTSAADKGKIDAVPPGHKQMQATFTF